MNSKLLGAMFLGLTISTVRAATPVVDSSSAAKPYYECMVRFVRVYAKKTQYVSEAIDAARSKCKAQRDDLGGQIALARIEQGDSGYQAGKMADGVLKKIDDRLHDELVQIALDAR